MRDKAKVLAGRAPTRAPPECREPPPGARWPGPRRTRGHPRRPLGLPDVQPSRPPDVPAAGHDKAIVTRASGVERRRLTVYLSPALPKRLVVYAAGAEIEMSEVAADAIEEWLQAHGA